MKPLIYGYMRVASDATDDKLDDIEQQMRSFAEVEAFCYATTFYECQNGSQAAFNALTEELKRTEAHHVVVPSMSHISTHPILLAHMVQRLELDAAAQVVELCDVAEHAKERVGNLRPAVDD
ncbi:recombinase family protein [Streptomyces sp. WMMC940]|uniref:recombinase family protein n=1 Tax=Streptomyces sp. WMMC940 TaxID=3015153 RepID=UPI0022B65FF2|nr:recombinase family protein [Streptomyces sp. WMMC940]MCZ7456944.1 recombinase family protein [Streptomyces sp. WMMC940]